MITREFVRDVRKRIEEALAPLGQELKVRMILGGGTFTSSNATFRLEVAAVDKTGQALTREAEEFRHFATGFGLQPGDLGREFSYLGHRYTITGLNRRSRRFPILADRKDGRKTKFTDAAVRSALDAEKAKVAT